MSTATAQPKTIKETRLCAICKVPMSGDSSDGRKLCDVCMGVSPASYPKAEEEPASKVCAKCKETFPLDADHWYGDRKSSTGFKSWCKPCDRENSRLLSQKNQRLKEIKPGPSVPLNAKEVRPISTPKEDYVNVTVTLPDVTRLRIDLVTAQVAIDFSKHPDVLAFFADLARDQERTIEAQIRWALRQLVKQRKMEVANVEPAQP